MLAEELAASGPTLELVVDDGATVAVPAAAMAGATAAGVALSAPPPLPFPAGAGHVRKRHVPLSGVRTLVNVGTVVASRARPFCTCLVGVYDGFW